MKIVYSFGLQFGLLVSFGTNFENRPYICIDAPFLWVQILWFKPKKKS